MRSAYMTPEVALGTRRPDELDADLLVVPAFETAAAGDDRWLDVHMVIRCDNATMLQSMITSSIIDHRSSMPRGHE